MKVVVVGSSHSGYEALVELLKSEKNYELEWYEKGDYLSFMAWGQHTYLEDMVKDVDSIRYSSAEDMRNKGVNVFPETELIKVIPDNKKIIVKDLKNDKEKEVSYDKLILGIGNTPNVARVPGRDLKNISHFGGRDNAVKLKKVMEDKDIKDVVVVGGGYIGLEAAISLSKNEKKVTMINRTDLPLTANLDKELINILLDEMKKNNINFKGEEEIKEFKGNDKVSSVVTNKDEYKADFVVEAIGGHPATKFLEGVIDMNEKGFIIIDDYMKTSEKDIFATGGATLIKYNPTNSHAPVDLATNARKQGRIAAKNLEKDCFEYTGAQGTSALKVFDYIFSSTGLNETKASSSGLNYDSVYIETDALDTYLPDDINAKVYAKLYFDKDSRKILGGQILSKKDLTGYTQALSMAIKGELTVDDLAFGDLFFQPLFNRPWNLLNELGLKAEDKLNK